MAGYRWVTQPEGVLSEFTDLDDRELVRLVKNDYGAFDILYRRYVTPVYRYCYARTDNVTDAEDLTALTFLACLEGIQRYRGRGSFSAWLFGIAHNKCADFHRRQYADRRLSIGEQIESIQDPADRVNPETQSDMRSLFDCVARGLPQLSADRENAVRLRYWGGLSIANVAKVMQRSPAAVKMLISRAIADLKERCVVK
jgi:RNA polymerase sigma-70 factor (ECF subfamily)